MRLVLPLQEVSRRSTGFSQSRGAAGGSGVGSFGQSVDVDLVLGIRTAGGLGLGPLGEVELQVDGDLPAQEQTD